MFFSKSSKVGFVVTSLNTRQSELGEVELSAQGSRQTQCGCTPSAPPLGLSRAPRRASLPCCLFWYLIYIANLASCARAQSPAGTLLTRGCQQRPWVWSFPCHCLFPAPLVPIPHLIHVLLVALTYCKFPALTVSCLLIFAIQVPPCGTPSPFCLLFPLKTQPSCSFLQGVLFDSVTPSTMWHCSSSICPAVQTATNQSTHCTMKSAMSVSCMKPGPPGRPRLGSAPFAPEHD